MNSRTLKIAYSGVLLASSMLLPMVFHLIGGSGTGAVFLPMHIPVLLTGFVLGPLYGLCIGVLAPTLNALIMNMPSLIRLPFMIVELALYGALVGILYHTLRLKYHKYGVYITLIVTMIIGRIIYAFTVYFLIEQLQLPLKNTVPILMATVTGIYGIAIQVIGIPLILFLLKKGGLLDGLSTTR